MVEYKKCTHRDIIDYLMDVRDIEINELMATSNLSLFDAITESIEYSDFSYSARFNGKLLALMGVNRDGKIWMVGTTQINNHKKIWIQQAKILIPLFLNFYSLLYNVVDVNNKSTIRFLKCLGFQFSQPIELKPGYPVMQFEMRKT